MTEKKASSSSSSPSSVPCEERQRLSEEGAVAGTALAQVTPQELLPAAPGQVIWMGDSRERTCWIEEIHLQPPRRGRIQLLPTPRCVCQGLAPSLVFTAARGASCLPTVKAQRSAGLQSTVTPERSSTRVSFEDEQARGQEEPRLHLERL